MSAGDEEERDAADVADLTALPELHEASIASALAQRFARGRIYTNTGAILLAVNPFAKVDGLYDRSALGDYLLSFETRATATSHKLPPHIYQVAGEAYRAMVFGLGRSDQSILVSGESGSGKTESTKFLMEYLAAAGDMDAQRSAALSATARRRVGIAGKVLQTNTVLESFGNARTLRNDNSSRFGKFIKLHFTGAGRLTGASIQTYLLEKVRLVSQAAGERNYHVFYEMSRGASPAQRQRWFLDPPGGPSGADAIAKYRYLNQSACVDRRDGVDDVHMFRRVAAAMDEVGFTRQERDGVFDLLAALLHVGNLTFAHDESDGRGLGASQVKSSSSSDLAPDSIWSRDAAAALLAVDARQLERALSVRKIRAGTDFVSVKLSRDQANNARDALAKALYGRLFDWMVTRMNAFLSGEEMAHSAHFIGILDIFGFEVFPRNSFEQLCINFANETLQQQFNDFVFKLEQREYEDEGVAWQYVPFLDNQDCVQLISQRPVGILPLIDDECLMPKGSDATLASKLYRICAGHQRFQASRIQQARGHFTILHYAGPVEYASDGFLEKNKDVLHQEAVDLLVHSPQPGSFTKILCHSMLNTDSPGPRSRAKSSPRLARGNGGGNNGGNKHGRGASVGLQFKEQLATLLETLQQTEPHYVRCLKPNDQSAARVFDRERVGHQLRCSGVLEAVRVSRAGFPIRMPLVSFVGRYFSLRSSQRDGARNPLLKLRSKPRGRLNSSFINVTDGDDEEARRLAALVAEEARGLLRALLPLIPKMPVESPPDQPPPDPETLSFVAAGAQVGRSKIFLKKNTYELLEQLRARRLRSHMAVIFHAMLAFSARLRFLRVRRAVVAVQCAFRRRRQKEQRHALAMVVQRMFRGARQRKAFHSQVNAVRVIQCRFRYRRMVKAARARKQRQLEMERERREAQKAAEEQRRLQQQMQQQRQQQQMQQQQPVVQQFNDDSYTASSDSSSDPESSLASNDIEGSITSSGYSDYYDGAAPGATGPSALTPVQEVQRYSVRKTQTAMVDTLGPLGPQPHSHGRMSRAHSNMHSQSHPQMLGPGGGPLPLHPPHHPLRKSSFRSTRSSRAVALPRLDVVQETQWVNDEDRFSCHICNKRFSMFKRKHHCRACGEVICNSCSLYHRIQSRSMRVCVSCVAFHSLDSPTSTAPSSTTGASGSRGFSTRMRGPGSGSSAASSGHRKRSSGESSQPVTDDPRHRSSTLSSGLWLNPWPEPPYPEDEDERLTVLRELNIRGLAQSGKFNMYCEVAAKTMKCPIAYVSIIDEDEQILVANIGMAHSALPRELSFCAHTICQPSVLVVLDTKNDERFRENPMVKGDRKGAVKIRYYAGATIFSRDGHALGTVAVLDTKPRREADQEHIGMLQHLSFLASEKMTQTALDGDSSL